MTRAGGPLSRPVLSTTSIGVVAVGAVAWIGTAAWAQRSDMGAMPGTMDMAMGTFVVMWSLMMTAMMLPSVAPVAALYGRTVTAPRVPRLVAFGAG